LEYLLFSIPIASFESKPYVTGEHKDVFGYFKPEQIYGGFGGGRVKRPRLRAVAKKNIKWMEGDFS